VHNEIGVEGVFKHQDKPGVLNEIEKRMLEFPEAPRDLFDASSEVSWGIKDPQFTDYIDRLENLFPTAKYVVIVRDPRAVVSSYLKNRWGLATNAYTGGQKWRREVMSQRLFMEANKDRVIAIRYEDLINDLEAQVEKVCAFFGVVVEAEMLSYYKNKANYSLNASNKETNKAPDAKHVAKWKRSLTPYQINVIETVADDEMTIWGYEKVGENVDVSSLKRHLYKVHQAVIGEILLQYQLKKFRTKKMLKKIL
jgi:hypothetical protein